MQPKLVTMDEARCEYFAGMAKAGFYREFVNSGALRTTIIGARRYTRSDWLSECLAALSPAEPGERARQPVPRTANA